MKHVYKYTSYKNGLKILQNLEVRFSQQKVFNDPFDMSPSFDIASKKDLEALPDSPNGMKYLTPEFIEQWLSYLIPTINQQELIHPNQISSIHNNDVAVNYYNEHFAAFCLTECPRNLLMWSHYADTHAGLVLQFDKTHAFFTECEQPLNLFKPITYSEDRPVLSLSSIKSLETFFIKSPEWQYDKEWRLIKQIDPSMPTSNVNRNNSLHLFPIPNKLITGIVIGVNMPQVLQDKIIETIQTNNNLKHINIHYCYLDDNEFRLSIHPIIDEAIDTKFLAKACSAR
jgi:hypothetical protein